MPDPTRAEQVLTAVLRNLENRDKSNWLSVEIERSWTEGDDVFCLVYRQPNALAGVTLGLRRTIEPNLAIGEVVDEVISGELGEPLGNLFDTLRPDAAGVMWWDGNPPEWKAGGQ